MPELELVVKAYRKNAPFERNTGYMEILLRGETCYAAFFIFLEQQLQPLHCFEPQPHFTHCAERPVVPAAT